ncbi:MAG: UDP-N-acetylmuramoyl-L-alanine--D-glutamate ligase [Desulfovibrionaceae bacterium]|nr:UDP-N-acetylmuramoyl-L-alanine--D-glutamate ligase [Desulfovibrionaceae bacterium]
MACDPSLLKPIGPGTRAVVVGAGRSGRAAARLLRAVGASVRLLEKNPEHLPADFAAWAGTAGVSILTGEHHPAQFDGADLVIPSPGAALSSLCPLLDGCSAPDGSEPEVLAETELAWRQLDGEPVIGITGTSGKTTTTSLCAAMLEEHGLNVFTGGNIGTPLSEYALERRAGLRAKADVLVLELSSFQLQTCQSLRPRVGVLLNIAENHLDYHKDMAEYIEAKMRLFRCQTAADLAVLSPALKGLPRRFRLGSRISWYDAGAGRFPDMRLLGSHNQANAEAAWLAAREFGVSLDAARRAAAAFKPLPHRLESVAELDGVLYVNDSKCTTLEALKVALAAFDRPVLLLAGGTYKGGDAAALGDLVRRHVRAVGLFGASRDKFEPAWKDLTAVTWDSTLREALARLRGLARPGEVVLLSPATSSYDQYTNYKERGEDFRRAVLEAAPRTVEGAGA